MKNRKFIKIINTVLIVVFVFAAFNIGKIYYDYNKANNTYEVIQDEYVAAKDVESNSEATQGNEDQPPKEIVPPIAIDFDALLDRNKDVIGWLYCPDTVINYPVVQGKNNDRYLRKDLDGKYLVSGTLFADYRNGELNEDANYIIYGHNMKNGTMFSSLAKYKQQSYYNQHPIMYYLTPDGNYKLELFAGLVVKRDDKIYLPNQSEEEFTELIEKYRAKSTFKTNVELEYSDTIVTLSTCSYEFDNARYIVIGRLIAV
ncbi:MAG: class B sortase [Ruminococcaceae bacterium]|nr:class B sortase [Oscillospiraceae bacterium]